MAKAIIFDLDGVIIDSEPMHLIVDREIIRSNGIEISDDILLQYIGVSNKKLWNDLIQKYHVDHTVEELVAQQTQNKIKAFRDNDLKPIKGVVELIHSIRDAGLKTALASSSPLEFITTVLEKTNLLDCFDVILSGENFKRGKPFPDIFLAAAEKLNENPHDCVVIEDSEHGTESAKKAGALCIGFRNPGSGNQDLSLADIVIDSFDGMTYEKLDDLISRRVS